jgi:pyruvate ferredoxin oxidoreductase gamma subunit
MEAVKERFPGKVGDRNAAAIQEAYTMMKEAKK